MLKLLNDNVQNLIFRATSFTLRLTWKGHANLNGGQ